MVRSSFVVVSDDQSLIQKAQQFGQMHGVSVQVMSPEQWESLNSHSASSSSNGLPSLVSGSHSVEGAKVLPFPGSPSMSSQFGSSSGSEMSSSLGTPSNVSHLDARRSVATINHLESVAIENAITAFRGNLTEAAKALGIGRATLYRKVKQYNIDPSQSRRKKAA